ncbi:MAG: hypothetical protein EOP17_06240 [Rhizobiaceae bacterium]|nr:MAG: hypothetical protein EOP17_06240 [Rhizobiaceae bacterium]
MPKRFYLRRTKRRGQIIPCQVAAGKHIGALASQGIAGHLIAEPQSEIASAYIGELTIAFEALMRGRPGQLCLRDPPTDYRPLVESGR